MDLDPSNKKLNAIVFANRAVAKLRLKNFEGAISDCEKSIDLNENYFKSYLRRAEARMETGEFEAAISDYKKVHELDPSQNVRPKI